MTDEQVIQLAEQTRQLITNPALLAAFAAAEEAIVDDWRKSAAGESGAAGREALHAELAALKRFRNRLFVQKGNGDSAVSRQMMRRAAR